MTSCWSGAWAAYALLQESGRTDAADLLRTSTASIQHDTSDNWNGGTTYWNVLLEVPAREFARLRPKLKDVCEQITAALTEAIPPSGNDFFAARLIPIVGQNEDWRSASPVVIPRAVRRNIFDGLLLERVNVFGALDDTEFLSRIYELRRLPSTDSRYKDAAGDIYQHRVNILDWDDYRVGSERAVLDHCHEHLHVPPVVELAAHLALRGTGVLRWGQFFAAGAMNKVAAIPR